MKKWIDDEIVSLKYRHTSNHKVKYCVYYDGKKYGKKNIYVPKNPVKEFKTEMINGICFSGLLRAIEDMSFDGKRANRFYAVIMSTHKIGLTLKEKKSWVKIAKRNRLLPPYFGLNTAKNDTFVLDLTDLTPSLLYCYFSTFRFIREDPGFVRAMVYLVEELKIDFFMAFVFATRICMTHIGHSVVKGVKTYPYTEEGNIEKVPLQVSSMIGLRRFIRNPKKYDERTVHLKDTHKYSSNYNCQGAIYKACGRGVGFRLNAGHFKNDFLRKAIRTTSDEKAVEYLKKVK